LVTVTGLDALHGLGLVTGDLGNMSFSTGGLTSGSLQTGGAFSGGGTFTISGNGVGGIPKGTIFTGSFVGPVAWRMITLANGTHAYSLSGSLTGTWYNGATGSGATVQLTINTGKNLFDGSVELFSGDVSLNGPTP